ncbi:hypothetical protein [Kineococcus rubinsiae]|uniref:hypothetical protein n=1 Tax=Kineococcus rubinsiae TaxID=2609562 RepID=UPI001432208A|nr:hypothetical protein [Kineococcus rubinsiae]NIZ90787.1 hypothetical protein [Kineococcus rubinsiae]
MEELQEFALSYNAYRRIADSPERLLQVVRPVVRALDASKSIPTWVGMDLLRAAMFYVQRRARATEYDDPSPTAERYYRLLARRISELAGSEPLPRDHFG